MKPLNEIATPALAYLGDCVLELCVREHLVACGLSKSAHLNDAALAFVRASAQAAAIKRILPLLDEEETRVFLRGRNSSHIHVPKSATIEDYRAATGMETLFGYLHLEGRRDRIDELFRAAYPEKL
ncbi:MAG: ribonuclease III [Clostridia bacterium]|nr:ribonuclease III [Clostridia bacterium]